MDKYSKSTDEEIFALVATCERSTLLRERSIPSILNQTSCPKMILVVDDSVLKSSRLSNRKYVDELVQSGISIEIITNQFTPGAAGSWNSGIEWIYNKHKDAWIAFLDDDDEWSSDHLEKCSAHIKGANIVISGLRIVKDNKEIAANIPRFLNYRQFFSGNPGWQGSNTFIKADFIKKVGGFDEKLLCTHDRDLAIRCLKHPECTYKIIGQATAKYYLESDKESLTLNQSNGKTTGLLQFYYKHYKKMAEEDKNTFLKRANFFFNVNQKLFSLLHIETESPRFNWPRNHNQIRVLQQKLKFYFLLKWRNLRIKNWAVKILGHQYTCNPKRIEIDITYDCNLKCNNCNRSCKQAPDKLSIKLEEVIKFVDVSISRKHYWQKIRIMGGEPTLHPEFEKILYTLIRYKYKFPDTRIEVITNGYGRKVQRNLQRIPPLIHVNNSKKTSKVQKYFEAFNLAPIDDPRFGNVDFASGCSNISECGISLTPMGYYPCSLSGGIDRITQWKIGRDQLPESNDKMHDILIKTCPLCGRFKSGVFVPYELRKDINGEQISKTWVKIYQIWKLLSSKANGSL